MTHEQAQPATSTNTRPVFPGIHHITAMAGDAQRNVNFYSVILGQRLIKTTVNFDDPGTYHLYYADATGTPGTVMTHFPWPNARRGRPGAGEASTVAYTIPAASLDYWRQRLEQSGVTDLREHTRFGQARLSFLDPDGMELELVGVEGPLPAVSPWPDGPIPTDHALAGFHSVTLRVAKLEPTDRLLTQGLGLVQLGADDGHTRYAMPGNGPGRYVDVVVTPNQPRPDLGVGSIHHIALRVPDDPAQLAWRAHLTELGFSVTEVRDRNYFHSIYFREPGGVLVEIATDTPGFAVDEDIAHLGETLRLPAWLEPRRAELEASLPTLVRYGSQA